MSLQVFACPECTQPFQVDSSQAGQKVRCPSCNAVAEIPNSDAGPPVDPSPVEESPTEQPPIEDQGTSSPAASEKPQPFRCPSCSNVFGVLSSMFGSAMACPHCQQPVVIGPPPAEEPPTPPVEQRSEQPPTEPKKRKRKQPAAEHAPPKVSASTPTPVPPPTQPDVSDSVPVIASINTVPNDETAAHEDLPEDSLTEPMAPAIFEPQPVSHLLPPKFAAIDPAFFYRANRNGDQVLLPTADGSLKAVNNRIVTIVHNGQEYQLISSPRYRAVQNAVVNALLLFIAAVLLFAIYWTVTS